MVLLDGANGKKCNKSPVKFPEELEVQSIRVCQVADENIAHVAVAFNIKMTGSVQLRVWKIQNREFHPVWSRKEEDRSVYTLTLDTASSRLFVGSDIITCYDYSNNEDGSVSEGKILWKTDPRPGDSDAAPKFKPHITCIELPPKNSELKIVVVGRGNNVVQAYDDNGKLKWERRHCICGEGAEGVTTIAMHPTENYVFTGAWDHCIRGWNLLNGTPYLNSTDKAENQHGKCPWGGTKFRFSEDNLGSHKWGVQKMISLSSSMLLSGGHDGRLRMWDPNTGTHTWKYPDEKGEVFFTITDADGIFMGAT